MNLPNKITTFRMIAVAVLVAIMLFPYEACGIVLPVIPGLDTSLIYLIGAIIFAVASISDWLDGYLARKYNLVSTYGKFMDPIADKLLVNTLLIILAIQGPTRIPAIVVVIMIGRDILVDGLRLIGAEKKMVIAANIWGKLKTVFQMVAIIFVLLNDWPFAYLNLPFSVSIVFCYLAGAVSLLSGIFYFISNRHVFKD